MQRQPETYEHSLTVYLKAKKEFKLTDSDAEPQPANFGLSDWEAGQIKKRVEKELTRTF